MNDEQELINGYSDQDGNLLPVKTILSLLPGGSILGAPGQKLSEERLTFMFDEVKAEFEALGQEKIDKSFFNTEEGYDLMEMAFSAAVKTRQKEKLKVFAKILVGAATEEAKNYEPELYLKIVNAITEKELMMAKIFYDVKVLRTKTEEGRDENWYPEHFPEFTKQDFEIGFIRLTQVGLIKLMTGRFDGGGSYEVTPLLSGFFKFIKVGGSTNVG